MRVLFKVGVIVVIFLIFAGLFLYIRQNYLISYIKSSSMEPTYYRGDIVIVRKVSSLEINVGDVIVFVEPGGSDLILHRVAAIKEDGGKRYFLTKGDNPKTNPMVDRWTWVPEDNVIGVLVACVPYVGWIFLAFDQPGSRLMFILLILLIFFLYWSVEEGKNVKFLFMTDYMRASKTRIYLFVVLLCFLAFTCFSGILRQHSISISVGENISVYSIDDEFYIVVSAEITSKDSIVESLSIVKFTIRSNNITIGYGVWSIKYPFYGTKSISIAILLDLSGLSRFPSEINIAIDVVLKNYVTGYEQGYSLGEKTFWLSPA